MLFDKQNSISRVTSQSFGVFASRFLSDVNDVISLRRSTNPYLPHFYATYQSLKHTSGQRGCSKQHGRGGLPQEGSEGSAGDSQGGLHGSGQEPPGGHPEPQHWPTAGMQNDCLPLEWPPSTLHGAALDRCKLASPALPQSEGLSERSLPRFWPEAPCKAGRRVQAFGRICC